MHGRRAHGFTYLGVMLLVLAMSAALAGSAEVWHTEMQREKERELLFAGNQFRQAIGLYYAATPPQQAKYPARLEDLLKDPRQPATRRYLRKLYPDPMTGRATWGLVRGEDGGIVGVYSLAEDKPLKEAGFDPADRDFTGSESYTEWHFVYRPDYRAVWRGTLPAWATGAEPGGLLSEEAMR